MNRWNYTCGGYIREFENGNLNIRLEPETIKEPDFCAAYGVEKLQWILDSLDCYFFDEGCAGNDEMYMKIYNFNADRVYTILLSRDIDEKFLKGKTVKLYAHKPDEEERVQITEYFC